MKKCVVAAAIAIGLFGFTNAGASGLTFRVGGGFNSNWAPDTAPLDDTQHSGGVHISADFRVPERPFSVGVFGEYYFKKVNDNFYQPYLLGVSFNGLIPVAGGIATLSVGPQIGLLNIDLGTDREMAFHLGLGVGVDLPLAEKIGLFSTVKYAWAAEKDDVKTMSGLTIHGGLAFRVGK